MTKIFAVILLLAAGAAWAGEIAPAKIQRVRAYTSLQGLPAARNFTIFTIDRLDRLLADGCSSLFIPAADKEAFSILLMAKAQTANVLLGYEPAMKAPWGDNSICAAVHVEVM